MENLNIKIRNQIYVKLFYETSVKKGLELDYKLHNIINNRLKIDEISLNNLPYRLVKSNLQISLFKQKFKVYLQNINRIN